MTVEHSRVGDILQLVRRPVIVDPLRDYEEIGIRSFGKGIFHKEPISGAALGNKRVFQIHPGELVLSNVFAWEGGIAVSSTADEGKIGSHRFMTYQPTGGRVDVAWAGWFFLSEPGMDLIRKASPGSAGRNRTLAVQRFEEIRILLPPMDKQRKTAATLDSWKARLRELGTAIDRESPQDVARTLPVLVDSVLSSAHSGQVRVADLVELVSDIVHPGDDPGAAESFVGLQHVEGHTGRRLGATSLGLEKGRKFRFQPGDVIYGYLRPYLNKVWVADRHGLCSVDQYVLRPKPGTSAELVAHGLRSRGVLDQAIEATHSLQLPRLRSGLLLNLVVAAAATGLDAQLEVRLNHVQRAVVALVDKRAARLRTVSALLPSLLNREFGQMARPADAQVSEATIT